MTANILKYLYCKLNFLDLKGTRISLVNKASVWYQIYRIHCKFYCILDTDFCLVLYWGAYFGSTFDVITANSELFEIWWGEGVMELSHGFLSTQLQFEQNDNGCYCNDNASSVEQAWS